MIIEGNWDKQRVKKKKQNTLKTLGSIRFSV